MIQKAENQQGLTLSLTGWLGCTNADVSACLHSVIWLVHPTLTTLSCSMNSCIIASTCLSIAHAYALKYGERQRVYSRTEAMQLPGVLPQVQDASVQTRFRAACGCNINVSFRYVFKNLMRDWSQEGAPERTQSYGRICQEAQKQLAGRDADSPPRVLVPGLSHLHLPRWYMLSTCTQQIHAGLEHRHAETSIPYQHPC